VLLHAKSNQKGLRLAVHDRATLGPPPTRARIFSRLRLRIPPSARPLSVCSVGKNSVFVPLSVSAVPTSPPPFRVFRVFRGPLFRIPFPPFAGRIFRSHSLSSPPHLPIPFSPS
jgi:hypothetical protein